jgi:pyruvate dehydrogenase phosphatase
MTTNPQSGKYITEALSIDQTGFEAGELARVRAAHLGEPDVIDTKTERTLDLAVTRAFGEGRWNWPVDVVKESHEKFFYNASRPGYLTPPYLIAEPVVITTQIRGEGEMVILASDGLWEHMSSEQAVKLVEMRINARKNGTIGKRAVASAKAFMGKGIQTSKRWRRITLSLKMRMQPRTWSETHSAEEITRRFWTSAPLSRSARDDIVIQDILFEKKP